MLVVCVGLGVVEGLNDKSADGWKVTLTGVGKIIFVKWISGGKWMECVFGGCE